MSTKKISEQKSLNYFTFQSNRKEILSDGIANLLKEILEPLISFKMGSNCIYSNLDVLSVLANAAMNNFCVEDSSTVLQDSSDKCFPNGDTVLYHIKKHSFNEILEMFKEINDHIFKLAKRKGAFRKKVDVAIDCTDELYYGDKNDSMIVGRKHKNGTSKAYRYATLSIVEKNQRFILAVLPVSALTDNKNIIEFLLQFASAIVRINKVYLDRGFFSVDAITTINEEKQYFIMPAVKNSKIKKMAQQVETPSIHEYKMGTKTKNVSFRLVFLENEIYDKSIFATNIPIESVDEVDLSKLYSKRWGIETGYRMRNTFRAKTTSKNYIVRLFLFMFSVSFYNLWILFKLSIMLAYFIDNNKSIITAKNFISQLAFLLKIRV